MNCWKVFKSETKKFFLFFLKDLLPNLNRKRIKNYSIKSFALKWKSILQFNMVIFINAIHFYFYFLIPNSEKSSSSSFPWINFHFNQQIIFYCAFKDWILYFYIFLVCVNFFLFNSIYGNVLCWLMFSQKNKEKKKDEKINMEH